MSKLIKIGNKLVKFGTKLGAIQTQDPHTVEIGGRVYRTVTMPDGKEWLAENLDFLPSDGSIPLGSSGSPSTPAAWYYDNDEATYGWEGKKYGLLYNWYAANSLAIAGWHLPSTAEWDALATACGGSASCGTKLKSATDWDSGNGTDDFGFTAFPSGCLDSGTFRSLGTCACFWTSTAYGSARAYDHELFATLGSYYHYKTNAYSVRLVKDS